MRNVRSEQAGLVKLGDASLRRPPIDMAGYTQTVSAREFNVFEGTFECRSTRQSHRQAERHELLRRGEMLLLDAFDIIGRFQRNRRDRDAWRKNSANTGILQGVNRGIGHIMNTPDHWMSRQPSCRRRRRGCLGYE